MLRRVARFAAWINLRLMLECFFRIDLFVSFFLLFVPSLLFLLLKMQTSSRSCLLVWFIEQISRIKCSSKSEVVKVICRKWGWFVLVNFINSTLGEDKINVLFIQPSSKTIRIRAESINFDLENSIRIGKFAKPIIPKFSLSSSLLRILLSLILILIRTRKSLKSDKIFGIILTIWNKGKLFSRTNELYKV